MSVDIFSGFQTLTTYNYTSVDGNSQVQAKDVLIVESADCSPYKPGSLFHGLCGMMADATKYLSSVEVGYRSYAEEERAYPSFVRRIVFPEWRDRFRHIQHSEMPDNNRGFSPLLVRRRENEEGHIEPWRQWKLEQLLMCDPNYSEAVIKRGVTSVVHEELSDEGATPAEVDGSHARGRSYIVDSVRDVELGLKNISNTEVRESAEKIMMWWLEQQELNKIAITWFVEGTNFAQRMLIFEKGENFVQTLLEREAHALKADMLATSQSQVLP